MATRRAAKSTRRKAKRAAPRARKTPQSALSRLGPVARRLAGEARADFAAVVRANRHSFVTLRNLGRKQLSTLNQVSREWNSVVRSARSGDPQASIAHLNHAAQRMFRMMAGNLREFAKEAARSQSEVFALVKSRARQRVREVNQLLRQA